VFGKALRSSDWDALAELLPGAPVDNPVRDQLAIRARHDPSFGEPGFVRTIAACSLLDREPPRRSSRESISRASERARSPPGVGVPQVAFGRPSQEIDSAPELGLDPVRCQGMRWLDIRELPAWPRIR
jgi:hypothetical protein